MSCQMAHNWYAIRSKPRQEEAVWRQILSQGFKAFYPRLRVHPVNPRSRKVKPYFPGYLFVQADLDEAGLSVFQWMPHAVGLISFGGEPAVVPDHLIQAIKRRVDEINAAGGELLESIGPGDSVWINEGPFHGYEAIFDSRLPGSARVRVLIEFLGNKRKVPVTLLTGQVKKIKR
jgi:transcription antitermination factor NusG